MSTTIGLSCRGDLGNLTKVIWVRGNVDIAPETVVVSQKIGADSTVPKTALEKASANPYAAGGVVGMGDVMARDDSER